MSGYLLEVTGDITETDFLGIGIRFGSKGFSCKFIGDLKISFDIKENSLQWKNKSLDSI